MASERFCVVATGAWMQSGWQAFLQQAGCKVIQGPHFDGLVSDVIDEDDLRGLVHDADAILVATHHRITRRVLASASRLRIVARPFIGVDNVDVDAATDLGILVVNSPAPSNYLGVAEATIGQILALTKRLVVAQRWIKEARWSDRSKPGRLLAGQTIGIVGLGRIGSNVARRLGGWDVRILASDPYIEPANAYAVGAQLVDLDTLIREADVVTLHVCLNRETTDLINEPRLSAMKPTAYLVNTSRGGVVDQAALVKAIEGEWIAGAALDVFAEEPLPLGSPLRRLDPERVILTPHCIGSNAMTQESGVRMASENILCAVRGDLPACITNPSAITRWRQRFGQGKENV